MKSFSHVVNFAILVLTLFCAVGTSANPAGCIYSKTKEGLQTLRVTVCLEGQSPRDTEKPVINQISASIENTGTKAIELRYAARVEFFLGAQVFGEGMSIKPLVTAPVDSPDYSILSRMKFVTLMPQEVHIVREPLALFLSKPPAPDVLYTVGVLPTFSFREVGSDENSFADNFDRLSQDPTIRKRIVFENVRLR